MMKHILDDDALDVLASIEGDDWKRHQARFGVYSFFAVRDAVREATALLNVPMYAQNSLRDLASDLGQLVIYGAGGWQRYTIDGSGFIVPIAGSFSGQDNLVDARKTLGVV